MNINLQSTKFIQAMFIQVTGAIALFMRIIDGGVYVALSTLSLTIYAYADVQDKKNTIRAEKKQ